MEATWYQAMVTAGQAVYKRAIVPTIHSVLLQMILLL